MKPKTPKEEWNEERFLDLLWLAGVKKAQTKVIWDFVDNEITKLLASQREKDREEIRKWIENRDGIGYKWVKYTTGDGDWYLCSKDLLAWLKEKV